MTSRTLERPRGYVLVEALVGSSIATVAVLGSLVNLADAETRDSKAMRRTAAVSLLNEQLETTRSIGYASLSAGTQTRSRTADHIPYKLTTVVSTEASEVIAAASMHFRTISVTVASGPVTVSLSTRMYE